MQRHAWMFGAVLTSVHIGSWVAAAQSFPVALQVTERTGGIFDSAFRTALRSLGDVNVVTVEEHPFVLLSVVVLCRPDHDDCQAAVDYAVSIEMVQLLDSADIEWRLRDALQQRGVRLSESTVKDVTSRLAGGLSNYRRQVMSWAAGWPRNAYKRAIEELIGEIDSKCLERGRVWHRMTDAQLRHDSATARSLGERWLDTTSHWLNCL